MSRDKIEIGTFTGKSINPFYTDEDDICIEDIAHALSMQCRFNGHICKFYSVAEHSLKVSDLIRRLGGSPLLQMYGLLHDASEAYICDIPKPFKDYLDEYLVVERVLQSAIEYVLIPGENTLNKADKSILNIADAELALQESKEFYGPIQWQPSSFEVFFSEPLTPEEGKKAFLERYHTLEGEISSE